MQTPPEDEISLFYYWETIFKRKKLIALIAGSALLISTVVSFLLPNKFDATARIMPPEKKGFLLPQNVQFAPLAMTQGISAEMYVEELSSFNVMDAVIRRFDLMRIYGDRTIEGARKDLKKKAVFKKSDAGIISITVRDRNPQRAAGIANAFVEELDRVNRSTIMSSGKTTRIFLGKRLADAKEKLDDSEQALKRFQEANNAVKIDAQSEAIIKTISDVKRNLLAKEVELKTLKSFAATSNPQLGILKTEVNELRTELARLESGGGGSGQANSVFIPTSKFPGIQQQYEELSRDYKIRETLYEFLMTQYEKARITEVKDSPTLQVLDKAYPPDKKAAPNRILIILFSTFTATVVAVLFAFFIEYLENYRDDIKARHVAEKSGPPIQTTGISK